MRRLVPLALFGILSGCSLLVGPGEKYLSDGGAPDGGGLDGDVPPLDGDAGPPDASTEPLPPVGSGVGLSDYRPVLGQTLRATVGPYFDPNGDPVSVSYQWTLAGSPIDGASTGTLRLDPADFGTGDAIGVTVTLSDGERETVLRAGPAVVADDETTRWRLLSPPRATDGSMGFLDPARQRLLYYAVDRGTFHGLWEMQLGGSEARWVRLDSVEGTLATYTDFPAVTADPARDRVLFFGGFAGGGPSNRLFTLVSSEVQGSERWASLAPAGDPPAGRVGAAAVRIRLPDGEEAVFYFGGLDGTDTVLSDGWLLHLEDGERWERLDVPMPPGRVAALAFFDEARSRVFLAGGADETDAHSDVYVWDLEESFDAGFGRVGDAELDSPIVAGSAVVEGDTAYLFGGGRSFPPLGGAPEPNPSVFALDLDDLTLESVSGTDGPAESIVILPGSRAPFEDGYVVYARSFLDGGLGFYEVDPATGAFEAITADGVDLPPPLMQGQAMVDSSRGLILGGGRSSTDDSSGNGTLYAFSNGAFRPLELSGEGPGVRWGNVADNAIDGRARMHWFWGGAPSGEPATSSVWRLRDGASRWEEITVAVGNSIPDPRVGHVSIHGVCRDAVRGNILGVFGGRLIDSGTITDETWMSDCEHTTDPPGECEWFDTIASGGERPGAVWAAVTQIAGPAGDDMRYALVAGGLEETGPTDRVTLYDACDGPEQAASRSWVELTRSTTDGPEPMLGHSLNSVVGDDGVPRRAYWLFGGTDEQGESGLNPRIWRMEWNGDTGDPQVTFTQITAAETVAGERPRPRVFHLAAYDPDQNRILVYGGLNDGRVLDDLWELRLRTP